MRNRFYAWLARQLAPHLDAALRVHAAAIVADIEAELQRRASEPQRRSKFIGS